jgi:heme exporter protein D
MIWNSASEFFAMGGYGPYVWGSFGLCAIAFAAEWVLVKQRRHAILARLRRQGIAGRLEQEQMA